jgi:hypothetical protein
MFVQGGTNEPGPLRSIERQKCQGTIAIQAGRDELWVGDERMAMDKQRER